MERVYFFFDEDVWFTRTRMKWNFFSDFNNEYLCLSGVGLRDLCLVFPDLPLPCDTPGAFSLTDEDSWSWSTELFNKLTAFTPVTCSFWAPWSVEVCSVGFLRILIARDCLGGVVDCCLCGWRSCEDFNKDSPGCAGVTCCSSCGCGESKGAFNGLAPHCVTFALCDPCTDDGIWTWEHSADSDS